MQEQFDQATAKSAISTLEAQRCELISQGDIAGLAELLADDYVHVHATGRADDKAATLKSFERSPRDCSRGELNIRVYGNVAVITGPQFNLMRPPGGLPEKIVLNVTTVARRGEEGWRLVSFHACRQG